MGNFAVAKFVRWRRRMTERRRRPRKIGSFLAIWSQAGRADVGRYADECSDPRWAPRAGGPTASPAPPLADPAADRHRRGGAGGLGRHRTAVGAAARLRPEHPAGPWRLPGRVGPPRTDRGPGPELAAGRLRPPGRPGHDRPGREPTAV